MRIGVTIAALLVAGAAGAQECWTRSVPTVTYAWEAASGPVDHYRLLEAEGGAEIARTADATAQLEIPCAVRSGGFSVAVAAASPTGVVGQVSPGAIPLHCTAPGRGSDLNGDGEVDASDFGGPFLPSYWRGCKSWPPVP